MKNAEQEQKMCPEKWWKIIRDSARGDVNYAKILNGMEIKCNRYLDLIEIFSVGKKVQ